jgi:hypothetical protein
MHILIKNVTKRKYNRYLEKKSEIKYVLRKFKENNYKYKVHLKTKISSKKNI